ncbi:hypothetical protein [Novacetimonas pomaceti]|uniref:hypothetical protein n=2 Tax=Acetobacteraceae TaxID=433 RepID=UPI001C2D28DC|nr:hypothetical protein [Novacetimonas pomaceti]MBV1833927.1 hypothetical protein [Novacetimonas pomaceti]
MNTQSDYPTKTPCDPHEEWRLALIQAWKNRRGYTRPTDTAYPVFEEDFLFDELLPASPRPAMTGRGRVASSGCRDRPPGG